MHFDVLLVCRNAHVLDNNGGIEAFGHGRAGVGELPVSAAHPRGGVGNAVFEIGPAHGDGVHAAGQDVRHGAARRDVFCQNSPERLVEAHHFDSWGEMAGLKQPCHGFFS